MSTAVHAYGPSSSMRNTPVHAYRAQIYGALSVMVIVPALCILGNQAGLLRIAFPSSQRRGGAAYFIGARSLSMSASYAGCGFSHPCSTHGGFSKRLAANQPLCSSRPTWWRVFLASHSWVHCSDWGSHDCAPTCVPWVGIAYGAIIGFARFPLFNVLQALLNWIVPVIFGLFLYLNRDLYAEFRRVIDPLVSGRHVTHGSIRHLSIFWRFQSGTRMWMLNVQMNSFGKPEATQVRIFSTMNAPAIFAAVTACGLLLLLLNVKGKLWVPCSRVRVDCLDPDHEPAHRG